MTDIKFGAHIGPQHCTIDELRNAWIRADDLGFDWISTWDHLYAATHPPGGPCFEAVSTHAALAALTTRARVGSLVYCAPFRHPALLANAAVTIDHLSNGRLELGVGAGWQAQEHEENGFPFDPPPIRLRRLAETIEIIRALWTEDSVDYDGEFYTLRGARCEPKPIQTPPRIWVGTSGEKVGLQLAGRLGDGWNLVLPSPEDFTRKRAIVLDSAPTPEAMEIGVNLGFVGCDDRDVELALRRRFGDAADLVRPATLVGSSDRMAEHVARYVDAGARWIVLALRAPFELDALDRFATEVIPRFRQGHGGSNSRVGIALASHEWFGRLAGILTEEVAAAPDVMAGATFSFQEVFKGVPPDGGTVAWHARFADGRIVGLGYGEPIDGADVQQIVEWEAAVPIARMMTTDAAYESTGQRLNDAGAVTVRGDYGLKRDIAPVFARLHDRLAQLTAPI